MKILGIDPGQSGGLAIVDVSQPIMPDVVAGIRMPTMQIRAKKAMDVKTIENWLADEVIDVAVLEQVSSMPRQGVASSFQFGRSFGAIEYCAHLHAKRVEYVTPSVWKKAMGLSSSKQASLDLATQVYGSGEWWPFKADDGVAEAALLVKWFLDKCSKAA